MDEPPPQAHSFVVKIWAKDVEDPGTDAAWRGHITHVDSGDRQYLKSLMDLPDALAPHVTDLGGTLDTLTRLCLWLAQSENSTGRSA